jgi:GNAT superfamily N-acetyltransferase
VLAEDEEDFGLAERSAPTRPLTPDDAAVYLRDPTVLHWGGRGRRRRRRAPPELRGTAACGRAGQLLLYDIGVREAIRRRGVGTALVLAMRRWTRDEGVDEAWVLADSPDAEAFYTACGFARDDEQPIQMTLRP